MASDKENICMGNNKTIKQLKRTTISGGRREHGLQAVYKNMLGALGYVNQGFSAGSVLETQGPKKL